MVTSPVTVSDLLVQRAREAEERRAGLLAKMSEITEKELLMIQVASYRAQKNMARMTLSESITE